MFFSRSRNSDTSRGLMADSKDGRAALESAFRIPRTGDDKANMVGELVDMKVNGPTQVSFISIHYSDSVYKYM